MSSHNKDLNGKRGGEEMGEAEGGETENRIYYLRKKTKPIFKKKKQKNPAKTPNKTKTTMLISHSLWSKPQRFDSLRGSQLGGEEGRYKGRPQ